MKVIISRKGLDSENGGIPSPVIKTQYGYRFFPIPIPSENSNVKYSDLLLFDGHKVSDFLRDNPLKAKNKNVQTCHLDPDIRMSYLPNRPAGWQRAFGQSHIAQDHLRKYMVGEGDVFLFFGWFQYAELVDGKFKFIKSKDYPNGFHAIYGYLQVDEIIDPNGKNLPAWLANHPHVKFKGTTEFKNKSNVVYTSAQLFKYKNQQVEKNGSALFNFNENLILTRKGEDKRTHWELPSIFHPENGVELSYNTAINWGHGNGKALLNSADKGQEFIVKADPDGKIAEWCNKLIRSHTVAD